MPTGIGQVLLAEDTISSLPNGVGHVVQRISVARSDHASPHRLTRLPSCWGVHLATRGGGAVVGYEGTDVLQVMDGDGQFVLTRHLTRDGSHSLILHALAVAPSGRVIVLAESQTLIAAYE